MNSKPVQVEKGLWVTNWQTANDESFYLKNNITARLTVMNDDKPYYSGPILLHTLHIYAPDGPGFTLIHLKEAVQFLWANNYINGRNILAHCVSGSSRSVSCVVAYITKFKGGSVEYATDLAKLIRIKRGCEFGTLPNSHVWSVVLEYLKGN